MTTQIESTPMTIDDLPPAPPIGPPKPEREIGSGTPAAAYAAGLSGPPPAPSHPSPSRWWWLGGVVVGAILIGSGMWAIGRFSDGQQVDPDAAGPVIESDPSFESDPDLGSPPADGPESVPTPDLSPEEGGAFELPPSVREFLEPDGFPENLGQALPDFEDFFGPDGSLPRSGDGSFSFRFGTERDPLEFHFDGELPDAMRELFDLVPSLLWGSPSSDDQAAAAALIEELLSDEALDPAIASFVRDLADRVGVPIDGHG